MPRLFLFLSGLPIFGRELLSKKSISDDGSDQSLSTTPGSLDFSAPALTCQPEAQKSARIGTKLPPLHKQSKDDTVSQSVTSVRYKRIEDSWRDQKSL